MSAVIKIDIISDIVCPWCIIGYKRLLKAIEQLDIKEQVNIQFQPFELNPSISSEGENIIEHMNYKYGMSVEQVKLYQIERIKTGDELGFKFDSYDEMKIVNTRDCHVLLEYAQKFGKQIELQMRLFEAHFSERKDISNRTILEEEVKSVGLDVREAMSILDGTARIEIQEKEDKWKQKGISSVPSMIFNDSMLLNGAYPIEKYKEILLELLEEKA